VVLVPTSGSDATAAVERVLATVDPGETDVVVVDNGLPLARSQLVAALGWRWPEVQVVPAPSDRGWAIAHNLGLVAARTDLVVLLDADARPQPGWLAPLREALTVRNVRGVQSLGVDEDGLVVSGGAQAFGPDGLPHAVGVGTAPDLTAAPVPVGLLTWGACAFGRDDLVALEGLDPLIRPELAVADLCLRRARREPGSFRVLPASRVTLPSTGTSLSGRHVELDAGAADMEGRAIFSDRWRFPTAHGGTEPRPA
jgi:glycosyltransferase involved in cell wall biosynthesis